jgi:hypothetical protein
MGRPNEGCGDIFVEQIEVSGVVATNENMVAAALAL